MTKEIQLTQGKVAIVDDDIYEYLSQWKWGAQRIKNKWYAIRSEGPYWNRKRVYMHRVITNAPAGMDVDHRDNDGLNNTDENLRVCTRGENLQNRSTTSMSGFHGVWWSERYQNYQVTIKVNGKQKHIGCFKSSDSAARAYDAAAKMYQLEYLKLNFPED